MTHPLSILIADIDHYFSLGLRLGLQAFFQTRHQQINLLEESHTLDSVDIIFVGNSAICPPWLYRLHQQKCYPLVFFIKDKGWSSDTPKRKTVCEQCGSGTLYRHQDISVLHDLLDRMLVRQETRSPPDHRCQCQRMSLLTPREVDVLQCLTKGMSGRSIAIHLDISEKTVNAHKQSAMRKLNFRRNQELYHWLLQGGTRYLKGNPHLFEPQPEIAEKSSTLSPTQLAALERSHQPFHRHRSTTYEAGAYVVLGK